MVYYSGGKFYHTLSELVADKDRMPHDQFHQALSLFNESLRREKQSIDKTKPKETTDWSWLFTPQSKYDRRDYVPDFRP